MSNKFNYRSGPAIIRPVPVASGTAVEIGDLIVLSSGKAVRMATTTDNLAFIGVAAQRHSTVDASGVIGVYMPHPATLFEYDLDASTAITLGDDLQYNGRQTLKKSATDPIATAMESKLSATTILCSFRLTQNASGAPMLGDAS